MNERTISRRAFGSLMGAAVVAEVPARAQSMRQRGLIIDSHQHFDTAPDYIERLVKIYRPRNAMACVLTPISGLETVKKAAAAHPDVVIPYGRVSVDDPGALAEIDKFAAAGFKGVKMHTPRLNWDDPHYFPTYARLLQHQMLALFHTGISFRGKEPQYTSMARMRPSFLDTITRAFPDLWVQGAHFGNPWYDEAAEAARWAPRLYFDLTGSTLIKKAKNYAVFKEYLWWEGAGQHSSPDAVYAFEKLVFGTDEPPENLDTVIARHEAMFDACGVPEASRVKIFGTTMAKILGIQPRA